MSELDFQSKMIDRMARIEAHMENIQKSISELAAIKVAALHADQSSKSAHLRIDDLKKDICWTLGVSVTVVGIFASILTAILR